MAETCSLCDNTGYRDIVDAQGVHRALKCEHGRNGLGIDDLHPHNPDPVACHYRDELRGAGRVMHGHDGSPLPP